MIFRHKLSGVVVQGAVVASTTIEGKNYGHDGYQRILYITKDDSEQLFTESDVQKHIESALSEHLQVTREANTWLENKVETLEEKNQKLLANVGDWQLKCDRLEEEKEELNECIAELEAAQQPVEVSAELAEAIEFLKLQFPTSWEGRIFEFFYKNLDIYKEQVDILKNTSYTLLTKIIKRGYTVKPDPLRTRIAAILGSDHEQLDAVVAAVREGETE